MGGVKCSGPGPGVRRQREPAPRILLYCGYAIRDEGTEVGCAVAGVAAACGGVFPGRGELAGAGVSRGGRGSALRGAGRGRVSVRRGWEQVCGSVWVLGPDDPGACVSSGGGGDSRGGRTRGELWRVARRRGESGGAGAAMLSIGGEDAVCQLRDGGVHVGDPAGARVYRAEFRDQVRGLLSRARGCSAGEGGVGHGYAGNSIFGGGSGGDGDAYAGAAVQRSGRSRGGVCGAAGRDCVHHRGAGGGQCGDDSSCARLSAGIAQTGYQAWRAADCG